MRWTLLGATVALALVYLATVKVGVWWATERGLFMGVQHGLLGVGRLPDMIEPGWHWADNPGPRVLWWFGSESDGMGSWVACAPIWAALLPLTAGTGLVFWRARRRLPSHCPNCRYDRSGLPAGAVCPECGAPASTGSL
jgi:hypothetical protein